jgi:hypothetical protein
LQFETLGQNEDDDDTNVVFDSSVTKSEIETKLINLHNEKLKKKAQDPTGRYKISLKDKRKDGFLNIEVRTLTICAFLRCLNASIEYAPTEQLRQRAILNIRNPSMFKQITMLCDTTNWDAESNIGAKYLRVMRNVIKVPFDKDKESIDMLMHYEMISIVIQKALFTIR